MPKKRLAEFMAVGFTAFALTLSAAAFAASPSSLKGPLLVQAQTNQQAQQSQDRINELASQKNQALQSYLTTMQRIDRLKAYNQQIQKLIKSQKQRMVEIHNQMERLGREEKQVVPLMLNMIDTLRKFVKRDMPFKRQQRLEHIEKLENMMDDAGITIAEKFRQIVKAYEQQLDYGNTISAYRGKLHFGGKTRTVQFVRIGRVALMYQTLNGSETGYWNRNTQSWTVDNSLAHHFQKALGVANESGAPQLIVAPVPAPITAEAE